MSDPKKFALYGGILMFIIGVLAFVPTLYWSAGDLPALTIENSYGYFLGYVPMNIFNKSALIVFGLMGIAAATWRHNSLPLSIKYSRMIMVVMGVLAVLGLFEQTNTLYGYWPLFGANIVLYALFAVVGGYFGFKLTSMVPHTYEKDSRVDQEHKHHFKMPHFGRH